MNINEALNVLNLKGTVSKEELAKAYKRMAIKYHPDKNPSGVEMMKIINNAYEFLKVLNVPKRGTWKPYEKNTALHSLKNRIWN